MIEESLESARVIPIYFLARIAGTHELNPQEFQGFKDKELLREGLHTEIWYLINVFFKNVEFESNPEDESLRFLMHINQTMNINDLGTEIYIVQIYSWDKHVYIKSIGEFEK